MTFEERMAELGVDLSDLRTEYSQEEYDHVFNTYLKWGEEKNIRPLYEGISYLLHLTDIIDRMETRLVNLTGERDFLIDSYVGCEDCAYGADAKFCEEPCVSCEDMEHFEWGVPEDWRADDD